MAKVNKRTLCIVLLVICKITIVACVYKHYKSEILEGLFACMFISIVFTTSNTNIIGIENLAIQMRSTPYSSILMTAIVCFSCVPPLIGFTIANTMSGYVYGFPNGCIPVILGAFLGALIPFILIRKLHARSFIKPASKRKKIYSVISGAIHEGGFKIILLIRLCPVPWQLTSLILSVNEHISFNIYCITACVGSLKLIWAVWLGSQLASLNNPDLPPEIHQYALISLAIGLTLLAVVGAWMYRLTMQKIRDKQADQEPLLGHNNDTRKYNL